MALLSIKDVTFTFTHPVLLDGVTVNIERGERVGLVGRNGAGKSTLLKLIGGELKPDDGGVTLEAGACLASLMQHVPDAKGGSIFAQVSDGIPNIGGDIAEFRTLDLKSHTETLTADEQLRMDSAIERIGAEEKGWDALHSVERTLREMSLDPDQTFDSLSAGKKRRVLLARALVTEPDVLLLDEPTNHLDIDSILWLQDFLSRYSGTLIFVTHDRAFLQALANRIIEVDRGRLFDWTCDYATFLTRRDAMLEAEEQQQALFDKKLAEEERWIRQGIKARRTRNEGRVRALKDLREVRKQRRDKVGKAKMQLQEAERSGMLVSKADNVSFAYDDQQIIRNLSTTIFRGDRIGLIGPNGVGKTTLLKVLLNDLKPNSGTIRVGTNTSVAYFDQLRAQLEEDKSVRENIGDGSDYVLINGQRKHVVGYLQDFLFSPDRVQTRVSFLSGGERNRLLLARLFTKPANILVLDEPTNDLDAETLELLEELLAQFSGTLLLVSHDRAFLNNVATSTFVFEGDGVIREFDGGYDDWLRQKSDSNYQAAALAKSEKKYQESGSRTVPASDNSPPSTPNSTAKPRKLSFKEQRELETLPRRIEEIENRQQKLHALMADPSFYQKPREDIAAATEELEQLEEELMEKFDRWESLESQTA
ncbi:MAG: ATP-binding cassette domain-containing protein [Planctomycetaceae bacterium]|nr:ATP-binding cassette domain-containing protein [Planctomycetaceae bacterium]